MAIIPYSGTHPYIFISYSHLDKDVVFQIITRMYNNHYRLWYDEGIEPGQNWGDKIAISVQNCKCIFAFVSKNYVSSDNCLDELNMAINSLERANIILIYLEDTIFPSGFQMRLSRTQAVMKYQMDDTAFFEKLNRISIIESCLEQNTRAGLCDVNNAMLINNCVPAGKIVSGRLSDRIVDYLQIMNDKAYTYIPILDESKSVVGIFSESVLLNLTVRITSGEKPPIDSSLKFEDIKDVIRLDSIPSEEFVFLSKYSDIAACKECIKAAFAGRKRRLGAIFITDTGSQSEPLLGMITVWGILGRELS